MCNRVKVSELQRKEHSLSFQSILASLHQVAENIHIYLVRPLTNKRTEDYLCCFFGTERTHLGLGWYKGGPQAPVSPTTSRVTTMWWYGT